LPSWQASPWSGAISRPPSSSPSTRRLDEHFESAFDGMVLEPGHGHTVLVGEIRDQAHLHGLLDRLRDFGIDLVAVEPVGSPGGGPAGATV
jgi:hypothetical protein